MKYAHTCLKQFIGMKDFSRSHAAVAVTFDVAYVMLPESFDKKKKKENVTQDFPNRLWFI